MSNLKSGDLCLVISSAYPENNGKAVTLLEPHMPGEIIAGAKDRRTYKNNTGKATWHVIGDVVNHEIGTRGESFFWPCQLMKIDGDFQPEQQKSQEVPA